MNVNRLIDLARIKYVESLTISHGLGINIGCGKTRFEKKINFDITRESDIDVLGDVRNMPFRENTFDEVLFCEVYEHIPDDNEKALEEIERVMTQKGRLIMSVPYDCFFSRAQDYLYWNGEHKHFTKDKLLKSLNNETSLKIERSFYFGTIPNLFERILNIKLQLPRLSGTLFVIGEKI